MNYKETVERTIWSEPDEQRRVRRLGTKTNGEVFEDLKQKLGAAGLMPDEYFMLSHELKETDKIPDFDDAVCSVNFGGSEGIYLDIDLKYHSPEQERRQVHFATGKTLGENTFDFYRMSLIAGECSMLLNGDGLKIGNNTKTILILDDEETDIMIKSLELQAAFNNDVNRSNSEVYNLLQAINPDALNKFLENENDEELEV